MIEVLKNNWVLYISLFFILALSLFILKPHIVGDSFDYENSINFLQTGVKSFDFSPNRLLTTFGGLELIILVSKITRSINFSWIFINIIFYFSLNIVFYEIIYKIHNSKNVAIISTLFLASNYGMISFGLNFLMDIGGWFWYVLNSYFVYLYLERNNKKYLLFASLSTGVGLLFKEYAVLGILNISSVIIYENINKNFIESVKKIITRAFLPALLSVGPIILLYLYIYLKFDYTYLDWLNTNRERYENLNKISEYIKVFGSLLNFLGVLVIFGFYTLNRDWQNIKEEKKVFALSVFMSILPIFIWPGITQRVLFISIPVLVIISSFLIKKCESKIHWFIPVLVLYFAMNLLMDSFMFKFVNLPF